MSEGCCFFSVTVMRQRAIYSTTTSGVTQASNLGPIMFILCINAFHYSKIFFYADDLKLKTVVDSNDCLPLGWTSNL